MELARRAGEHRCRTRAVAPSAREAEQSPAKNVARKVLLRDGYLAALPTLPSSCRWKQDVLGGRSRRGESRGSRSSGVSTRFVESIEGRLQLARRAARPVDDTVSPSSVSARASRAAARPDTRFEMATHRADALLVGGRVEPKAAIRSEAGAGYAVLPRAEQLGRHTDLLPQSTDAQVRLVHGRQSIRTLDKDLTWPTLRRQG